MTPKQAGFVEEYLVDLNATQAAIRAGYSPKTAEVQGSRLLANAKVREAVEIGKEARSERTAIRPDAARSSHAPLHGNTARMRVVDQRADAPTLEGCSTG